VTFGGYRINRVRDNRVMKLNPTLVKKHDWFCPIKKSIVSAKQKWVKNCSESGLGIGKSPTKGRKNRIRNQW